jgi:hypothetical protein
MDPRGQDRQLEQHIYRLLEALEHKFRGKQGVGISLGPVKRF